MIIFFVAARLLGLLKAEIDKFGCASSLRPENARAGKFELFISLLTPCYNQIQSLSVTVIQRCKDINHIIDRALQDQRSLN